jgi:hypothetical protein
MKRREMVPSNDHQANLMPGGNPADNDNFAARCGACRGCWVLMQADPWNQSLARLGHDFGVLSLHCTTERPAGGAAR